MIKKRRAPQRKILVIDDEVSIAQLLRVNLEKTGSYLVQVENDSRLALPAALDFRPDLILMDVMMPGLDGGDLATLFSEHPNLQRIPIIFLTATVKQAEVDSNKEGRLGGFRFIAKPVELATLFQCLDDHFAQSGAPS